MIDAIAGRLVRGLILFSICLFPLLASQPAGAQFPVPATPQAAPTADDPDRTVRQLQDLLATIEDPLARERLADQLRALIAAQQETDEPTIDTAGTWLLEFMSGRVRALADEMVAVGGVFGDLPQAAEWLEHQVTEEIWRTRSLQVLFELTIAILAGFAAGRVVHYLLRGPRAGLESQSADTALARTPFFLLRLLINLAPVAAFAVAGYGVLALSNPPLVVRLVALTVINATVLIQAIMAVARSVFAPDAPGLRIPPISDESAHYAYIWVRRLAYVSVYGYFISRAAFVLGLPATAYLALLKLVGLVVAALLVILILQNRLAVANWLRGHPISGGSPRDEAEAVASGRQSAALRTARRRLAGFWHALAILYVVVIYAIWALNIPDGFEFMLRATVLTVVILLVARFVFTGLDRAIRHGFSIPEDLKREFPELEARANRYLPILHRVLKLAVWIFVLLALLNAWGIDSFAWLQTPTGQRLGSALFSITIILVLAVLVWEVVNLVIGRYLAGTDQTGAPIERSARTRTLLPLLRNAFLVFLIAVVTLIALSELGVNIAPLLAGAGVIGLAIGFGSQTLVKDVITGLFILIEDTISVGDVVDVGGGHSGLVEAISIRSIRLRDLSGAVHSVPFSQVATVVNLTKDFSFYVFDVSVAYHEDPDRAIQVLKDIGAEMQAEPEFSRRILEPIEILGVDAFRDSAVIVKARIKTRPIHQWAIGREFNRRLKKRFEELGIEIPFPQRTIHIRSGEGAGPLLDMARAAPGRGAASDDHKPSALPVPEAGGS